MKRTKHKLLTSLLAAALLLQTAMPSVVFAAESASKAIVSLSASEQTEYTLPLDGSQEVQSVLPKTTVKGVTPASLTVRTDQLDLTGSSFKTEEGVEENPAGVYSKASEGWSYDENVNTLTLNGLNLITDEAVALKVSGDFTIVLTDAATNSITSNSLLTAEDTISAGIQAEALVVRGNSGILNVRGGSADVSYGVLCDSIHMEGGVLKTEGGDVGADNTESVGLMFSQDSTVLGGSLTAVGGACGDDSSTLGLAAEFASAPGLTITGGTVKAYTQNTNTWGGFNIALRIPGVFRTEGGTVDAKSGSALYSSLGILAGSVVVSGGAVTAEKGTKSFGLGDAFAVGAMDTIEIGSNMEMLTGPNFQTPAYLGCNEAQDRIIIATEAGGTEAASPVKITEKRPVSSGGGGGGGKPPTSPIVVTPRATEENPNPPTTVETKVNSKTDQNGKATASVSDKAIADAIKKAQDEIKKYGTEKNGIAIVLNVNMDKNANTLENTLSAVSINALVKDGVTEVTIKNGLSSVTFDIAALTALGGGEVKLFIGKVDPKTLSAEAQKAIGNRPVFQFGASVGGKVITDFYDGRVGLRMPYALTGDEAADNLVGVYIDGNGKVVWLENSSYDPLTGTMYSSTNHFSVFGVGYREATVKFTDTANHWAKNDIDFVVARGLFSGTSNTTFAPDNSMTRGMFVTALGRLAEVDTNKYSTAKFSDVKADAYYAPYVAWANANNIVSGTTDTTFAPDKAISRQEMAVMLVNYSKAIGYKLPAVHAEVGFADAGGIASWAKDAVKQMQMAGTLMGKSGNRFDPTGTATRAEVAAMFCRFLELVVSPETAEG